MSNSGEQQTSQSKRDKVAAHEVRTKEPSTSTHQPAQPLPSFYVSNFDNSSRSIAVLSFQWASRAQFTAFATLIKACPTIAITTHRLVFIPCSP